MQNTDTNGMVEDMTKKTSAQKRVYHTLDAERFVTIWQAASSRAEVVRRYKHLTPLQASSAATNLRKNGVKLKMMHVGKKPMHDYAKLNKLVTGSK
jgi:hypothetical protein